MDNLNDEDDGEVQVLNRAGGWQWWNWASLGIGAALVSAQWWRNRQLSKETQEIKIQIDRAQRHIRSIHNIDFYFSYNALQQPKEAKEKVVNTVLSNKLLQYRLRGLDDLEDLLVERQHVFCSYFRPKSQRKKIEEQIHNHCDTYSEDNKAQLKEVLESDRSCGSCLMYLWSGDKRRNGSGMWALLKKWREEYKEELERQGLPNIIEDRVPK